MQVIPVEGGVQIVCRRDLGGPALPTEAGPRGQGHGLYKTASVEGEKKARINMAKAKVGQAPQRR